ncbi:nucleotidyltransferase family protein [Paenibacillus oryzisoli]|uniref:nucleotidyltransferase family protein n=1 Tax=Paenibacillus oryzisoli TaxID=1850517 RepID=UPI003D29ADEC
MKLQNEQDIIELIQSDEWMMTILHNAKSLQLPDWWVCAGFVRAKIWDTLHGFAERTPLPDVDVVYYDTSDLREEVEKELEKQLEQINSSVPWSVKNEARMHVMHSIPPYSSSVDAISKFTETATALGISLNERDEVILAAPCGVEDVLHLVLRPTPHCAETPERVHKFEERIAKKNWLNIWDRLRIESRIT